MVGTTEYNSHLTAPKGHWVTILDAIIHPTVKSEGGI